ncbi:MAG: hypothetical protein ACK5TY_01715, partial [Verrucomicrobiota bacterium]
MAMCVGAVAIRGQQTIPEAASVTGGGWLRNGVCVHRDRETSRTARSSNRGDGSVNRGSRRSRTMG